MIINQDTNFILEWDEDTKIMSYTHIGYFEGPLLRSNALKMLDLLAAKKGQKLLLNTLKFSGAI